MSKQTEALVTRAERIRHVLVNGSTVKTETVVELLENIVVELLENMPAELLRQEALIAELTGALEHLIEGADSMLCTCTRHWGETPEDADFFGHEGWAEKFLCERKEAASAALAKVKQ